MLGHSGTGWIGLDALMTLNSLLNATEGFVTELLLCTITQTNDTIYSLCLFNKRSAALPALQAFVPVDRLLQHFFFDCMDVLCVCYLRICCHNINVLLHYNKEL